MTQSSNPTRFAVTLPGAYSATSRSLPSLSLCLSAWDVRYLHGHDQRCTALGLPHLHRAPGGATVRIAPLRFLPIIRDVLVDYEPFFTKYRAAQSYFVPRQERTEVAPISPASRERRAIGPNLECIVCGACYASCTMLAHDVEYLGPAALNRAFKVVRDSRDGVRRERLAAVGGEHGCWRCHSLFNCTEVCPKHLSPTRAIQGLKRAIVRNWLRNRLAP
jgi:fumarate reductase iron-sulfur subunit